MLEFLFENDLLTGAAAPDARHDVNLGSANILRKFRSKYRSWKLQRVYRRHGGNAKALTKMDAWKVCWDQSNLLHAACLFGSSIEVFTYLLKEGLDISAVNSIGLTPLDVAIHFKHYGHAEMLREKLKEI